MAIQDAVFIQDAAGEEGGGGGDQENRKQASVTCRAVYEVAGRRLAC